MAEYIEKETMRGIIRDEESKHRLKGCAWIEIAIDRQPAADVAPVRHGRWIFEPDGGTRCSKCNKRVRDVTGGLNAPVDLSALPYCPKCGAKMDGGDPDA